MALLDRLEALRNNTNLNESGMADNIVDQSENDELDEMDPEAMETAMFDDITELGMSFHMFDAMLILESLRTGLRRPSRGDRCFKTRRCVS
jgi:hypothetical protein